MFIPTNNQKDVCPQCRNEEDKETVCRHCGYQYSSKSGVTMQEFIQTFGAIIGISSMCVLIALKIVGKI
jgi:hypothetical protein